MRMATDTRQARDRTTERGAGNQLAGIGGLMIVAGAVTYIVHVVMRSVLTAGADPVDSAQAALWVPVNALGALGAALVLLGLPVVYSRVAGQGGPTGLVGIALIAVSWTFFGLFLSLYGTLVLPWLADEAPRLVAGTSSTPIAFVVALAVGLLAWLVGASLVAWQLRRESAPWIGYLLLVSALWFMMGSFVIAPDGPANNLAVNLLSNLGPVLLLIGLGSLGVRAWTDRAPAPHAGPAAG